MRYQLVFSLAAAAFLLPGEASAQVASGYQYQRTVVGPGGGAYSAQRSVGTVAGPFGATTGVARSGSYVAPGGATVEYNSRSGSVVGPMGGARAGSSSRVYAESGGGGATYSRYSSSSSAVGPVGGLPAGRVMAAAVGPFAAADYAPPVPALPQQVSDYQYERTVMDPEGGVYNEQRTGNSVTGLFGAASGRTRSGSYVAPSGATVEFNEQSGSVVGPLGGGWSGTTSRVHAESADRGLTYSRYSSHSSTSGPVGGGVAVGPYGGVGYRRSGAILWP
jgi:hypothetical protein